MEYFTTKLNIPKMCGTMRRGLCCRPGSHIKPVFDHKCAALVSGYRTGENPGKNHALFCQKIGD
jgi:hypothetical protein